MKPVRAGRATVDVADERMLRECHSLNIPGLTGFINIFIFSVEFAVVFHSAVDSRILPHISIVVRSLAKITQ